MGWLGRGLGFILFLAVLAGWAGIGRAADAPTPSSPGMAPSSLLGPAITPHGLTVTPREVTFEENNPLSDFEVHFFVSLPFTALYSYVVTLSLDGLVQGKFPPEFRETDSWMVIGLAVGSSLAVALGSVGQVPDQTKYQPTYPAGKDDSAVPDKGRRRGSSEVAKLELVRIQY